MSTSVLHRRRQALLATACAGAGLLVLCLAAPGAARALAPPPPLVAEPASGAVQGGTLLVTALPIENTGAQAVSSIRVTKTSLKIGATTIAGTVAGVTAAIAAGATGAAYGSFPSASLVPGTPILTIQGTARAGGTAFSFTLHSALTIAPAAPGSVAAKSFSGGPGTITTGAIYPHQAPVFPPEVNEESPWTVPIGPAHGLLRSAATAVQPAPEPDLDLDLEPRSGSTRLRIYANDHLGITGNTINEPSGAANDTAIGGGVVFVTFNSSAAFSLDGGVHWTTLDPTTIFPNAPKAFCCDQVVQYIPAIDRFVWLLQYWGPPPTVTAPPNLERIAVASPAAIVADPTTAWSFADLTPALLGFGTVFLDYPDLAVSDSFLYASFDQIGTGLVVCRVALSEVVTGFGNGISGSCTNPGDGGVAYGGHLAQLSGAAAYWAGNPSNSSLRVFTWPDSSSKYSWQDVNIGSWPNNPTGLTSVTPPAGSTPAADWMTKLRGFPGFAVLGATRVPSTVAGAELPDQLYFAWTGSNGGGFPQPQIQWVGILADASGYKLVQQGQISSNSAAFGYPALSSSSLGEVGISAETGGGGAFENHAVGFLLDGVLRTTSASDVGVGRFGDYVTIRRDVADPTHFDAFGYGVVTGPATDTRYVVFGRPPAPVYDRIAVTLTTGNDDLRDDSELIATLSGQSQPLCLKPSTSGVPSTVCANGSDSADMDGFNSWGSFFSDTQTYRLSTPQTSVAGFGTMTITLVQSDPTCESGCDNWDLQGITVKVFSSTGKLPEQTLLQVLNLPLSGNDCLARLKGPGNAPAVQFSLSAATPTTPIHIYVGGTAAESGATTTCANNGG